MRLRRPRIGDGALLGWLVFVAAIAIWELWARSADSFYVPNATEVLDRAGEAWPTSDFLSEVAGSLKRLAMGFVIGAAVGIAVGLIMGSSRRARRTLEPLMELARATPPIAIVPALIVVLGFGSSMRIGVIAFGVCFPVLLNTLDGVRSVSPEARDTASMLHIDGAARVFRIYFPAALPSIAAGLRIAISIGIVLMVLSEFVGEGGGLGEYILDKQGQFNIPDMYAGILFLGLLGYALNQGFLLVERRLLAWHYGAAGESTR